MDEKDSWGLTEEEKRERLREINQKNAREAPHGADAPPARV